MSMQIPLSLALNKQLSFADFYAGDNQALVQLLQTSLQHQHSDGAVFIWSGDAVGKTHLLQAACEALGQDKRQAIYLPLRQHEELTPAVLEDIAQFDLVCFDDIDAVVGDAEWEQALFLAFNQLFDHGRHMLFAANQNVPALGVELADLRSRLSWGFVYQVLSLNDEQKALALQQRAIRMGLQLPNSVAAFLLKHYSRDMSDLSRLLNELDQASLAQQRKLSVPFVKKFVQAVMQ